MAGLEQNGMKHSVFLRPEMQDSQEEKRVVVRVPLTDVFLHRRYFDIYHFRKSVINLNTDNGEWSKDLLKNVVRSIVSVENACAKYWKTLKSW